MKTINTKEMADQYVKMLESKTVYAVVYEQLDGDDNPIYFYRVDGEQVRANEEEYIEHFSKKYIEAEEYKNKDKPRNKLKM